MDKYHNRMHAGKTLATKLEAYANQKDTIVLALPRGGVPVAFEIAKKLRAPLDVFIVRKLGTPGQPELAFGAIALGGAVVFNESIIRNLNISQTDIAEVIKTEQQELERREKTYRGNQAFPSLQNKTVILVDDGVATGATIKAAIKALRQFSLKKLIVAVPIADEEISKELSGLVDIFYCPLKVDNLQAVGLWYDDFSQTEDEEVHHLLLEAKKFSLQ